MKFLKNLLKESDAQSWLRSNKQSVDQLVDSINASGRVIAAEFSVMLLIALILGFTLVVTDDKALIFEENIALPQGIAKMDIVNAYRFLPFVFFFMHAILLSMLNAINMKVRFLNQVLPSDVERLRLLPYAFLRIHLPDSYFLMRFLAFLGIAFIPLGLLVAITGAFLRYQHELITPAHQILVLLDGLFLIFFYCRILRLSAESWKNVTKMAWHTICRRVWVILENVLYILLIFLMTAFVLFNASILEKNNKDPRELRNFEISELSSNNWFDIICIYTNHYDNRWGCRYMRSLNEDLFIPPSDEILAAAITNRKEKIPETLKELRQSLAEKRDFSERSFLFANFKKAKLIRANLRNAHLEKADLTDAHLEGADLTDAHLEGADLTDAHLEGADLSYTHLEGAHLSYAHLERAHLPSVYLEGAHLPGVHLKEANLSGARLEGANLSNAYLEGANLSGARLEGANLSYTHLEGTNLSGAYLVGTDLPGAHLEGADLSDTHLEGANLIYAHLEGADLSDTHLEGADLIYAHLEGALFNYSNLHGTNLRGAKPMESWWLHVITMATNIPFRESRNVMFFEWEETSEINDYINYLREHLSASVGDWKKQSFLDTLEKKIREPQNYSSQPTSKEVINGKVLLDLACQTRWIAKGMVRNQLQLEIDPVFEINKLSSLTMVQDQLRRGNIDLIPKMEWYHLLQDRSSSLNAVKSCIPKNKLKSFREKHRELATLFLNKIKEEDSSCPGLQEIKEEPIGSYEPAEWMKELESIAAGQFPNREDYQCPNPDYIPRQSPSRRHRYE